MPGATTASEVFFDWAIWPKLFMMPHTVPNRPTKVALAPTVAEESEPLFDRLHLALDGDAHHLLDALTEGGTRRGARSQALGHRTTPFAHCGREDARHGVVRLAADAIVEILQRHARPERVLESLGAALQRAQPQHLPRR